MKNEANNNNTGSETMTAASNKIPNEATGLARQYVIRIIEDVEASRLDSDGADVELAATRLAIKSILKVTGPLENSIRQSVFDAIHLSDERLYKASFRHEGQAPASVKASILWDALGQIDAIVR